MGEDLEKELLIFTKNNEADLNKTKQKTLEVQFKLVFVIIATYR